MGKQIIFYDMEFTTWEGAMANNWGEDWQYREVVQIAACRFDLDTLEEVEEFDILVKPKINPILSDFFMSLTGLSNEQVQKDGLDFPDAFHTFKKFIGNDTSACYGLDHVVMRENCTLNNMPDTEQDFDSFNIGPWFQEHGAACGVTKTTNSGKLAATMGAPINSIQEHNALHDVRSICAAYRFLIQKGIKSPF